MSKKEWHLKKVISSKQKTFHILNDWGRIIFTLFHSPPSEIHENEAASILAQCLSGRGVEYLNNPEEGKIALKAALDGLLRVNKESLFHFNMLGEVMCSTLHDNTPVTKGETVAATRLIPLVASRELITRSRKNCFSSTPVVEVLPLKESKDWTGNNR